MVVPEGAGERAEPTGRTERASKRKRIPVKSVLLSMVSAAMVAGFIMYANPTTVGENLKNFNPVYFMLAVVIYLVTLFMKIVRWYLFVITIKPDVGFPRLAAIYILGISTNNATPGGVGGEPLRVYFLRSEYDVRGGHGLATIFAERGLDILVLTMMSLIGLIFIHPLVKDRGFLTSTLHMLALIITLVAAGLVAVLNPRMMHRLIWIVSRVMKKVLPAKLFSRADGVLERVSSHFQLGVRQIISHRGISMACFLLTVVIWLSTALRLYVILLAVGMNVPLPVIILAAGLTFILGVLIPGGGGNVATISTVLSAMGSRISDATTAGILEVLSSVVVSFVLGLAVAVMSGLKRNKNRGARGAGCVRDGAAASGPMPGHPVHPENGDENRRGNTGIPVEGHEIVSFTPANSK